MKTLPENATVAERIRFYRTKRHVNGDTLAERIGMSRHAIMDYEGGKVEPLLEDLKKMADVLGIEADKLFDDYYRFLDAPYSERIKQMRAEHGLTQKELGAMLGVGRRAVERWEHGKHRVARETWERLKELGYV